MATQNPLEMEGTYPLPEAQLDRFLLKALVPFPTADDLVTVLERTTGLAPRRRCDQVADAPTLRGDDRADPPGARSPATCCATPSTSSSRRSPASSDDPADAGARYVRFGASPRGAQALMLAAKVRALLDGRPSVVDRRRARRRPGRAAPPARRRLRGGRRRRHRRRPGRPPPRRRRAARRRTRRGVPARPTRDPCRRLRSDRTRRTS